MKRTIWSTVLVVLTAAAVGMELWGAFDHSSNTTTWTELIVRFIPAGVTTVAVGWLVAWLPGHFRSAYAQEGGGPVGRYAKFIVAAVGAAVTAAIPLYADGHLSGQDWLMIAAAAVGAVGVLLVPNKPAQPAQQPK